MLSYFWTICLRSVKDLKAFVKSSIISILSFAALTNRYGFRLVTIFGSLISSTAFALSYFAPSPVYLHLIYGVLGGIGFCFIYMPSVIIVGYYFEKWRPLATGIALCGSGVGTFILAPISTQLIENYGWRNALLMQAGKILEIYKFEI